MVNSVINVAWIIKVCSPTKVCGIASDSGDEALYAFKPRWWILQTFGPFFSTQFPVLVQIYINRMSHFLIASLCAPIPERTCNKHLGNTK